MNWPLIWFTVGLPVTGLLMVWSTFAIIHADEAKGRRREEEMKKRQAPNG